MELMTSRQRTPARSTPLVLPMRETSWDKHNYAALGALLSVSARSLSIGSVLHVRTDPSGGSYPGVDSRCRTTSVVKVWRSCPGRVYVLAPGTADRGLGRLPRLGPHSFASSSPGASSSPRRPLSPRPTQPGARGHRSGLPTAKMAECEIVPQNVKWLFIALNRSRTPLTCRGSQRLALGDAAQNRMALRGGGVTHVRS